MRLWLLIQSLAGGFQYHLPGDFDAAFSRQHSRFAVLHAAAQGTGRKELGEIVAREAAAIHGIIEGVAQVCLCLRQIRFLVCVDHPW